MKHSTWSGAYLQLGARGGVGLEWTPVVGGHVGGSAGYPASVNENTIGDDRSSDGWSFSTFSSGIVLHLFF